MKMCEHVCVCAHACMPSSVSAPVCLGLCAHACGCGCGWVHRCGGGMMVINNCIPQNCWWFWCLLFFVAYLWNVCSERSYKKWCSKPDCYHYYLLRRLCLLSPAGAECSEGIDLWHQLNTCACWQRQETTKAKHPHIKHPVSGQSIFLLRCQSSSACSW